MKMDGKIRVATDAKYKELYNNMKGNGVVEDFHALFFVCACLGFKNKKMTPIKKRDDRFWSGTITPSEWSCYYAIILEQNGFDFTKVSDEKEIMEVIERYANSGMEILIDEFLEDFLLPSSKKTIPQLDNAVCKTLPKQFVHFIFELSEPDRLE
ncbi:MAG: hypothetical protein ACD_59C00024G0003 [uncultured bacterium]|nr:MAG: hypothetical protein ACD_59C00024G0003 [uncultured bacterium]